MYRYRAFSLFKVLPNIYDRSMRLELDAYYLRCAVCKKTGPHTPVFLKLWFA
jgi:hypothetical protein